MEVNQNEIKSDSNDNNNNSNTKINSRNAIHITNVNLLKNISLKTDFALPDIDKLKTERNQRNENFLSKYDLHQNICESYEKEKLNNAAINIQRVVRGFLGRKKYLDLLYEAVLVGEDQLHQQQEQQQLEGEILIESYRIEREIEDDEDITRNRTRFHHANATKIQRAWREKWGTKNNSNKEQHVCCSCVDNFPDLYDYYTGNNTICFCCEEHRLLSNSQRLELLVKEDVDISTTEYEQALFDTNLDTESLFMNDTNYTLSSSDSHKTTGEMTPFTQEELIHRSESEKLSSSSEDTSSKSVLKSLEILQKHESILTIKNKEPTTQEDLINIALTINTVNSLSVSELHLRVKHLENAIVGKNLELLKELMIRDDLFTKNEILRVDADKLAAKEIKAMK